MIRGDRAGPANAARQARRGAALMSAKDSGEAGLGHDAALRAESIKTLYNQKPTVLLVGILNAAAVAFVLWGVAPQPWPAVWLIAICAVALARLVPLRRYRGHPGPEAKTAMWANLFVASAAANGIVWGAAGVAFFTPDTVLYQVFLSLSGVPGLRHRRHVRRRGDGAVHLHAGVLHLCGSRHRAADRTVVGRGRDRTGRHGRAARAVLWRHGCARPQPERHLHGRAEATA